MKNDLRQIADDMAEAIFQKIEADRTLIKSTIADVLHKELAVRFQQADTALKDVLVGDWYLASNEDINVYVFSRLKRPQADEVSAPLYKAGLTHNE